MDGQSVVVGAHYDTVFGTPGADDNASGVAVLIELAHVLSDSLRPDRSVIFVAFTTEETDRRGSRFYTSNSGKYAAESAVGMINIDTVGRLGNGKLFILGGQTAREWVHIFRGAGYVTGVDIDVVSEELDASDQRSFHEVGVPAVQLFTGPHSDYHRLSDTVDKIDPEGLAKVATVAKEAIVYLSGREGALSSTLRPDASTSTTRTGQRKVFLGTVPDFSFKGDGYRLSGVVPGSPAEACGLREGDIIVKIDMNVINGVKDVSGVLKSLHPGDSISITFVRGGMEMRVETEVVRK
jgi:Zn-dependent M28 family amino/carboxypeptidase